MTDPLGQSQVLPYLCGLSNKGYKFDLISFEKPDKYAELKDTIHSICLENNINWHPLQYTKKPPVLSTLYDLFRMKKKAKELQVKNSFSAVHCRSYLPAIIGKYLKLKYNIAFLFDMRGLWIDERVEGRIWNLKNPIFKIIYSYFKKLEIKLFRQADQIVSLTEAAIPEILKIKGGSNNNINVIPCCVDTEHFDFNKVSDEKSSTLRLSLGINESDFILTYLGSLSTWYMPDKMFDFFNVLKEKKTNAKFLILTHENPQPIISLAAAKGILKSDLIIRAANRNEIPPLLSISNATIYFITPSFSKVASSPTKTAELLCMGIPTICNDGVGDTSKIIGTNNAGFICKNYTKEEYSEATEFLFASIKNPSEKNRLRKIGEDNFSLLSGVKKYEQVYKALLHQQ